MGFIKGERIYITNSLTAPPNAENNPHTNWTLFQLEIYHKNVADESGSWIRVASQAPDCCLSKILL